jgi:hypothetical protein
MIKPEHKEDIINFGAFGYDAAKISSILEYDIKEVEKQLKDAKSELNILMQKGRDMADYAIDKKLFEMARSGDIKAMEKLDTRKRLKYLKK